MPNEVLEFFRSEEPRFKDVSDRDLTAFIGQEYPQFLQDKQFQQRFDLVNRQGAAADRAQEVGTHEFLAHPDDPPKPHAGGVLDQVSLGEAEGMARIGEQFNTVLADLTEHENPALNNPGVPEALRRRLESLNRPGAISDQFRGSAEVAGEWADNFGEIRSNTGGPAVVGELAQGATSLIPSLAVAPAGLPAMAISAGAQSYGAALRDAEKHYVEQGLTPREARDVSRPAALAQGFVTSLVTAGFGKTGVEAVTKAAKAGGLKQRAVEFARQAGFEGADEWTDQLLQSGIQKLSWREDITFEEALFESAHAGGIGAAIGGIANVPRLILPDGSINPERVAHDEQQLNQATESLRQLKQQFEQQTEPPQPSTLKPINSQPNNELPRPATTPGEPQPPPPTSRRVEPIPASEQGPAPQPSAPREATSQPGPKTNEPVAGNFPLPESALAELDKVEGTAPSVPLGLSRPAVADNRLRQMTPEAFDAHRIRVRKEIDELERMLDEGELDEAGERKLATVQDQFSAMETEEARRGYEGQYVGDVFREMLDLADARPGSQREMNLIMAAEVLQSKRPSDADLAEGFDWVGPELANDPNWKEVQGVKYERLQTRLQELGLGKPKQASALLGDGPTPAPRTDKAENSTSEKPAPDSASTIPSERPPEPAVKGRRSAPRAAVGDILDDLERVGGMMSASRARKELGDPWWKENKSLYEGLAPLPPAHNFIYAGSKATAKFKFRPDQALQALQESDEFTGKYDDMSLEEFKAEIGKASRERIETTKTRKREEKWLREEGRQLLNWEKATDTGAQPVQGGDLGIGDTLDVEGTPLEVIEVDPDTGDVILKDGKRFGRQRVGAEEIIYVEQIEQAEREADFAPAPDDPFALETHDDQSFQAEQDKVANQQDKRARRAEFEHQKHAPLEGTTGTLGQADIFGQTKAEGVGTDDVDLFSPPSPGTAATLNRATLPRQIDDATPAPNSPGIHPQQIREYLQQALDVPFRVGAGGKAGFFRSTSEVIRARKTLLNSLTVASHEIGHYLHKIALPDIAIGNSEQAAAVTELMELGAPGRGNSSANASSTKDYQLGEGVAEFIRLYLTDPATAQAEAPSFHKYATEHLAAQHPEIRHILDTAQGLITEHINQPIAADLRSMINWKPKAKGQTFSDWWDKLYDDWVSELAPLERAEQRLIAHGLDPETATRASQLATNYLGGWVGKVEYSLYQRQMGFGGQDVGPGLRDILAGVEDINEFAQWLVGNRVIEKEMQGKATGFNRNKLQDLGKWLKERAKKYAAPWKRLDNFLANELQIAVDAGFLSPAEARRIKQSNQFYVPFQRDEQSLGSKGRGRGFADVAKPLKSFVGSDGRIFNPLESIIKNVYSLRDAAERNRVSLALADAINRTDGGGRIGDRPAKKLKPDDVEVPADVLVQWARDMDFDLDPDQEAEIRERLQDQPLAFRLWRLHHQQADPTQGIFQIWREGKRERWQVDDAELYKALQLADATDSSIVAKLPFYKPLNWLTRVLRSGATLTVEFMGRNIMRDPITAGVYSKHGFVPFVDTARGLFSALRKDNWYWDYVKSGGRYADMVATDRKDLRAKLEEVTDTETAGQMAAKWGNPLLTLQKMSEKMELATRLAEFRRAKEAGASDVEAANASKDVTLNFARGGFKGRVANRLIPFYNAQIQDLDKFRREHDPRNLKNASKVAAKGFLYITVPSLLTWWLGQDDEEIQKLPEWRKQFFWNIRVGDQVFSLPKPFLLGQVYGTSVERALDYATDKDPNAVKKWFRDTLQMANPLPLVNPSVMPAGFKPAVEAMANHSFFRDAPLEGSADQRLPKSFRATPATSETAKYLSRMAADFLGDEERTISPIVIDNTVRGTMGGLGKYGTDALDFLAAKSGLVDVPPAPVKQWTEYPGIRAFAKSPYAANADVQRFYEGLRRAEQTVATMRDFQTIMDPKAAGYWRANAERINYYEAGGKYSNLRRLRQHADGLSAINKAMLVARESRRLTPKQKTARLKTLAGHRNKLAGLALKFLHPQDRKRTR